MIENIQNILEKARQTKAIRIASHFIFWLTVSFFYFIVFNYNSDFKEVSIIFTSGLLPVALFTTYYFNYVLVPKLLWEKQYVRFFFVSAITLLISTWISFLVVFFALLYIIEKEASLDPAVLHPELQVISLNFIIFLAISIKQIKRSVFIQQEKNLLEKTKLSTELKLKEAELKLLKAQIHPHFLFNTLNNLYGLTLEKSEEAPQLVLRLSEILDYILYKCNEKRVLLSDEIKNLKNYIEIERVRYSEKLKLDLAFPENTEGLQVAPLFILPFVENAFKHGVSNASGSAFVKLSISLQDTTLLVELTNSKNKQEAVETSKGIGLKNVKKRLDLMYPGKHILEINDDAKTYSVSLTLQLDK